MKKINTKELIDFYINFTFGNLIIPILLVWASNKAFNKGYKKAHVILKELATLSHVFLINMMLFYGIFRAVLILLPNVSSTVLPKVILYSAGISFVLTMLAFLVNYRDIKEDVKDYCNFTYNADLYLCSRERVIRELSFGIPTLITLVTLSVVDMILGLCVKDSKNVSSNLNNVSECRQEESDYKFVKSTSM
ncbi:hypothetical protein LUA82_00675 [Neoehrlichia mikurensis]|nr:hypothetical protein [Neoehrlichia mikurensis]UTO55594.1 hypothetical protein LUA82_00675 [Neoehrlichia mikurensis]